MEEDIVLKIDKVFVSDMVDRPSAKAFGISYTILNKIGI